MANLQILNHSCSGHQAYNLSLNTPLKIKISMCSLLREASHFTTPKISAGLEENRVEGRGEERFFPFASEIRMGGEMRGSNPFPSFFG
jgi:hypothetical protein